jgi:hypothetical protein
MIVGIQSSRNFSDYQIFLRAMGTALYTLEEDKDMEFVLISAGTHKLNEMALEFLNISERSFKARGIKTKLVKMPERALKQRIPALDNFIYFSLPKEPVSELVREAENKDIEVGIYRYA